MQFGMDVFLGSFFPGNDHKSPVVRMGCAGDQGDEPISPLGSQAGLGAGCFLTGDLDLSVALGRVFLLRNQNLTADRALLTGSQAVLGAGRGHCRNFNFRMCFLATVCCATRISPQTEHFLPSVRPSSVQVASLPGMDTSVCTPVAGIVILSTSTSSQAEQYICFIPLFTQVNTSDAA